MLNKLRFLLNGKRMNRKLENNDITIEQIDELENKGAIIIDVRSPQEFEEGHLKNAICIPDYEIASKIKETIINKNQLMIVYCSSGYRSKRVQKKLQNLGYENVYNLYNGISDYWFRWKKKTIEILIFIC